MERFNDKVLGFLFPIRCVGCGTDDDILCLSCMGNLAKLEPPCCRICASSTDGRPVCDECQVSPLPIDGIRAPYLMDGPIRSAIHKLKYEDLRAAAPTMGRLLGEWLESKDLPRDCLVPVPLHPRRMRGRGYNQSALLAEHVSRISGLPVRNVLKRTRDTPPQANLGGRSQRQENVEGGFICREDVKGAKVVLVDDVVTSGSTMAACAQALKKSGAASVWGIALAR